MRKVLWRENYPEESDRFRFLLTFSLCVTFLALQHFSFPLAFFIRKEVGVSKSHHKPESADKTEQCCEEHKRRRIYNIGEDTTGWPVRTIWRQNEIACDARRRRERSSHCRLVPTPVHRCVQSAKQSAIHVDHKLVAYNSHIPGFRGLESCADIVDHTD